MMRGPLQVRGKSGWTTLFGVEYYYASGAERRWLEKVTPGLQSAAVKLLIWQPDVFDITYRHAGRDRLKGYRPDAIITWESGEEWVIEIKNGALSARDGANMTRFAKQYPEKDLVLVWFGSYPKNPTVRKRLEDLRPHLHHIWKERR